MLKGIERLAQIKGYPLNLQTATRRNGMDMLKAGSFAGIIRLQVGSRGDPVDDMVLNGEFANEAQRLSDAAGASLQDSDIACQRIGCRSHPREG